jgi:hypothetical protein
MGPACIRNRCLLVIWLVIGALGNRGLPLPAGDSMTGDPGRRGNRRLHAWQPFRARNQNVPAA